MTMADQENRSVFVNAALSHIRLVSESFESKVPTSGDDKGQAGSLMTIQAEMQTDASCGFSVGLANLERPDTMQIEVDFSVSLSIKSTGEKMASYSSKLAAVFSILASGGFDDWTKLPDSALIQYFSTLNHHAVDKAERTLLEAGFRGVAIPRVSSFPRADP